MAVNKVIYGDRTLVDLTQDSVNEDNLLEGETAHDASGNPVTGTAKQGHIVQDDSGTDMTQRGTMQFKGMTVTDDATNGKTVVKATKTSVGLGNVPNVTTDNQTPTVTEASTRANLAAGDTLKTIIGKIKKFFTDIKDLAFIAKDGTSSTKYLRGDGTWQAFSKNTVGLGNVDNTADDNKPVPFVECSTARSTANKAVALTGFTLKTGSRVYVRFTDTGTSNPASGNLTLNVNGTGAKTIVDGKTNKSVLTYSSAGWFYNNIVSEFVYDGTYWVWMSRDNNTTYSAMSASELTTGTAKTLRTVRADYLKTGIDTLVSGKTNKTDIATVESGTTASRAYSVGELVYVSGTLYRVKTAIASGATFTVGTNVEVTNVSEVLKDSIKMVYDQYFSLIGTGVAYIDIDKDYPVDGYKLIGLNIASNAIGYVAQARIRNTSRITGFVQKTNGGVIATSETIQVGVTLTYMKI